MMRFHPLRDKGWLRAVLYALGLHAVVIALLIVGFRFTGRNQPVHGPLQAVVVREPSPEVTEKERAKREEEKRQREQEKQRAAEEERRKETEQKQKEEAERKKREEAQRQKEKEEAERKKQAAEAEKRKRDEERKKEEKHKQQAEQALREQLAEEERSRASARDARMASEADKYKAAIAQRVSRHWVRPTMSRKGLQCVVRVRVVPGGEVLEAKVVRSSGDAVFDRSVESAVHKASPLPLPENPELFERFREIEFIFRPED